MTMQITDVALDELVIDEDVDFRTDKEAGLDELAASIRSMGLMQPIVVSDRNGDGQHHVIAGRRRIRAYRLLGYEHIPAIIRTDLDDAQAQVVAQVIENLQREDVGPMDEARAYAQLVDFGMKQKDVAAAVGVSQAHVSGRLALLKLEPAFLERVLDGSISPATAVKLARMTKGARAELDPRHVDDREIAVVEKRHARDRDLDRVVVAIADATGLPVGRQEPGTYGYVSTDTMAELAGLTDDDKPKSHEWDLLGRSFRASFESDEDFYADLAASKAKALFVSGDPGAVMVSFIGSANLDKERKRVQEEQRQRAEEREAAARAESEAFITALQPIVDAPNKAYVLAALLLEAVAERARHWSGDPSPVQRRAVTLLGLTPEVETSASYEAALVAKAQANTTDAVRVYLALSDDLDDLLLHQGFLDRFPVEYLSVRRQLDLLAKGYLTRDQLTEDAEARLALEEEAEAEQAKLDAIIDAEVDRRYAEWAESDDAEGATDEECEAVRDEIRGNVEAEFESGQWDPAGDGGEEE